MGGGGAHQFQMGGNVPPCSYAYATEIATKDSVVPLIKLQIQIIKMES